MTFPNPAGKGAAARIAEAQQVQAWLDSLAKCSGWKEWILPKLTGDLEAAKGRILEAVATGENVAPKDAATYRGLIPVFDMMALDTARALDTANNLPRS